MEHHLDRATSIVEVLVGASSEAALRRWRAWADGPRQKVTSWWADYATRDPSLSNVRLCVEMVLGDTVIRVSTDRVCATSTLGGGDVDYAPGLIADADPTIEAGVRLGEPAAASRSMSMGIPSDLLSGWDLLRRGGVLSGVAEVCWLVEGMDHDLRFVLLRGDVQAGAFGAPGEPVQVTITDPRMSEWALCPEALISEGWTDVREDAVGRRVPFVLNGYPRVEGRFVSIADGGAGKVVICADPRSEFEEPAPGTNLRLFVDGYGVGYPAGNAYAPWAFAHERDAVGNLTLVVDLTGSVGPFTGDERVFADVQLESDDPADVLAVAERMVRMGTRGRDMLDPVLWAQAQMALPRLIPKVLIDADGDTAPRVVQWLEGALSIDVPSLHWCFEGAGFGPVVLDWRTPVSGRLVVGEWPVIDRISLYTEQDKERCFDEFELRWFEDRMLGRFEAVTRRDPSTSRALQYLRDVFGGSPRPYPTVEAHLTFDEVLATYAVEWLAAHRSWPSYLVEIEVEPVALFRFRLGENVDLTDESVGLDAARATVERKLYARGAGRLTLRVWHPYLTGIR